MNDLRESMRRAAESVEPSPDLEDVLRRARRRPLATRHVVVVSLVVAAILAGVAVPALIANRRNLSPSHGGHGSGPTVTSTVVPTHERLLLAGTFAQSGSLFAAGGGAFFSVTAPQSCGGAATLTTITDAGTLTQGGLDDPLACYFSAMAADPASVYLGTSVITKFSSASNELVRLDPATLAVLARRDVPGDVVALVTGPQGLYVAIPEEVLRLDPTTLATLATYELIGAASPPPPNQEQAISSLALGPDNLWMTVGTAATTTLYDLDPTSLAERRHTHAGSGQGVVVVADAEATWLVDEDAVTSINGSGVLGTPIAVPHLQVAAAEGPGLVLLEGQGTDESLVLLGPSGQRLASARAGDAGAEIAVDGSNVWILHDLLVLRQGSIVPEEGIAHFVVEGAPG